jgi:hypothetical protein
MKALEKVVLCVLVYCLGLLLFDLAFIDYYTKHPPRVSDRGLDTTSFLIVINN